MLLLLLLAPGLLADPTPGTPSEVCECGELRDCLLRAWEPCFDPNEREPPEIFWILQKPREVWRSPCRRQWRTLEHFDPDYSHINHALTCQDENSVCYAAVNVSAMGLEDFPRDDLKPCWENALACQIIHAQGCKHFDQDLVWQKCWRRNPQFAKYDAKFLDTLEGAWKCETLETIEKSRDDLIKYL